jgi:pimeloyl-ACP methyl ester carboxylesterase
LLDAVTGLFERRIRWRLSTGGAAFRELSLTSSMESLMQTKTERAQIERRPPTLVVWGKYDPSFTVAGATAYAADVPDAEIHILDAGHFALDEATDEIAALVRKFLDGLDGHRG